jgi:NADPH:quinone reductase-like Zn-dependent oxidoreductase
MEGDFIKGKLNSEFNILVTVPEIEDIQKINHIIYEELVVGDFKDSSKQIILHIINKFNDIEGVILGCTELPLIIGHEDTDLPLFNTTLFRKTKSVILPAYNNNLIRAIIGIKTGERELPALKPGQVLIKMEAAPCNPSDIAFIRGGYNITKPIPAVPGFEGAGVVVDTGSNTKEMLGKRVSSFTQAEVDGTWAEFFIADAKDCIVMKNELDFDQGACLSINPFTAWGLVEMAAVSNCKAIVQNAAGGQVAEFIRVLADLKGIAVINIVRKHEHIVMLKDRGATGSSLLGIDPMDIILKGKKLEGFNLNEWIAGKNRKEFDTINNEIQDLIISDKMKTEIQGCFKLDDVVNGIRSYIKSMSSGKVLFKP